MLSANVMPMVAVGLSETRSFRVAVMVAVGAASTRTVHVSYMPCESTALIIVFGKVGGLGVR